MTGIDLVRVFFVSRRCIFRSPIMMYCTSLPCFFLSVFIFFVIDAIPFFLFSLLPSVLFGMQYIHMNTWSFCPKFGLIIHHVLVLISYTSSFASKTVVWCNSLSTRNPMLWLPLSCCCLTFIYLYFIALGGFIPYFCYPYYFHFFQL